jgi:pilus assembly protein CpaC
MRKILLIIFLAVVSLAYAQDEEIKLIMGQSHTIDVSSPKRIVIGNPSVIDIAYATKKEVTINPKQAGSTTLVIWDNFGEQSYKIKVFREDIDEVKTRVDRLLSPLSMTGVYTKADEEEGKVILLGEVKTEGEKKLISDALVSLKDKVLYLIRIKEEEAVVEIEVQVLELAEDATQTLGFAWPGGINLTEVGSPGISPGGAKWSNLFKVLNLNRAEFQWSLDALIQQGKAKILSRPKLACQSGKEAELMVGGEKPILTSQAVSDAGTSTEVSYKEFGIKLNIKPVVTEDSRVKLSLKVEVSEIGDTAIVLGEENSPSALAYPLTKRNAFTELILDDRQTLAIGGLIKQKKEEYARKTPFLSEIPILGLFFRNKETKLGGGTGARGNVELFITLTPTIIRSENRKSINKQEAKAPGTTSQGISEPPETKYAQIIQKRILDNLTYPVFAREAGFQGIIKLGLLLSYQGEVMDVVVRESSGYKDIDDAAISTVKATSPYPPFPPSIESKELWIDIPIDYRLD